MISNDTSMFFRAFQRRKTWRETLQHNFKGNRLTSYGTKGVVITLWNLTKKYEVALKQQEVVPIKESEIDREEVAEVFRVLETPWERNLDGRFYLTLATMQHRRDSKLATPDITPEEWISYFAHEVKRRATPLLFIINSERAVPPLDLPQKDNPITMEEAPTRIDHNAMKKHQVLYKQLSIESLNSRRKTLRDQLHGKKLYYSELSKRLTNWELDLLSQMVRDNELPAKFDKTSVTFDKGKMSQSSESVFMAVAITTKKYEEVGRQ